MNQDVVSIKLIKTCFTSEHYPVFLSGKQTDDAALRFVAQIVRYTDDEDYITSILSSGFPDGYKGDSLDPERIRHYIESAREKEFDKGEDSKQPQASKFISALLENPDVRLFKDNSDIAFIEFKTDGQILTVQMSSRRAKSWIRKMHYDLNSKTISNQMFSEVHATLEAMAIYDGKTKEVHLRYCRYGEDVYLNLANEKGQVVRINKNGYELTNAPPISFQKTSLEVAMPVPTSDDPHVLGELQDLLGVEDDVFHRVLAFIICSMKPEGPYPCFITEGEQGSGKSFLNTIIKNIVDPASVPKLRLPRGERDLMITSGQAHLLVFDNISGISNDMSDALCTLSTGGGFVTRQLYTDGELAVFNHCRPYILNGISGITHRPDLLDRSISVKLPSMPLDKRKTEAELNAHFQRIRPDLLGKLLDIMSTALRNFDTVKVPRDIRMMDAVKWLMAAEPATGLPAGSLFKALKQSQLEIIAETMERNSLAVGLNYLVSARDGHVYEGTVGELLNALEQYKPKHDRYFPTTASHLSKELDRLKPALDRLGIHIEFGRKRRQGKMITIKLLAEPTLSPDHLDIPIDI